MYASNGKIQVSGSDCVVSDCPSICRRASPSLRAQHHFIMKIPLILTLLVSFALSRDCLPSNTRVRKEWLSITPTERKSYISAIQCLLARPSQLAATMPACKNAYHDFAAVHANQTRNIHFSGVFYAWHRHFLALVEDALSACGLPAGMGVPYWDWTLPIYQAGLAASPLFDGGAESLGADGEASGDTEPYTIPGGKTVPHGAGGGCVEKGPFAGLKVPFGPFSIQHLFTGLPADWAKGNEHCLKRDLNDFTLRKYNTREAVEAALASKTVKEFQGITAGFIDLGVHGGGHFSVGETMNDPFGSPQDPVFFLHHSMLDRVWSFWQDGDERGGRRFVYDGTSSIFNLADSPPVGNETVLTYGVLGRDVKMWETASHRGGLYCYRYA
jgi:tyrosinase